LIVEGTAGRNPAAIVAHLQKRGIDGVLLPPPLCDNEALLGSRAFPTAQVAPGKAADNMISVMIDHEAAAREAATHLIEAGHRHIAFIEEDPNLPVHAARRAGYEEALSKAGIAFDRSLCCSGNSGFRSAFPAAIVLLARTPRPTAIITSNDDMAVAATVAAHRLGLQVPADLSVCGFGDAAIATSIWPELSTVRQPFGAMARLAIGLLSHAVTARQDGRPVTLLRERVPFELMKRGSVSAPPRP
jgi:LacI family transcriptional regulator